MPPPPAPPETEAQRHQRLEDEKMEWLARKELQLLYTNRWYNLPVSTEDMMILVIDDFLLFFLIVTLLHLSLFAVWVRHHHKICLLYTSPSPRD